MKSNISTPIIVVAIVLLVAVVGFIGYKSLGGGGETASGIGSDGKKVDTSKAVSDTPGGPSAATNKQGGAPMMQPNN